MPMNSTGTAHSIGGWERRRQARLGQKVMISIDFTDFSSPMQLRMSNGKRPTPAPGRTGTRSLDFSYPVC
jgi:hypothetical protein